MGILDKVMFWKRKEPELELPGAVPGAGPELGLPKPGDVGLPPAEGVGGMKETLGMPEMTAGLPPMEGAAGMQHEPAGPIDPGYQPPRGRAQMR